MRKGKGGSVGLAMYVQSFRYLTNELQNAVEAVPPSESIDTVQFMELQEEDAACNPRRQRLEAKGKRYVRRWQFPLLISRYGGHIENLGQDVYCARGDV